MQATKLALLGCHQQHMLTAVTTPDLAIRFITVLPASYSGMTLTCWRMPVVNRLQDRALLLKTSQQVAALQSYRWLLPAQYSATIGT